MDKQKIFFSYARVDLDFVLKLAKDLQAAGANIWLDQLNIEAGERWDHAIEEALDAAECMIVVLSPTSVDSQNVMDEVSYALEEGKQVVPVLYHVCKIPFRLRRLQHIDFTSAYDSGFNRLLYALDLVEETPSGLFKTLDLAPSLSEAFVPVLQEAAEDKEAAPVTEEAAPAPIEENRTPVSTAPPAPSRPPKPRRLLAKGGLAATGILTVLVLVLALGAGKKEGTNLSALFEQAKQADQSDTLTVFEKRAYWRSYLEQAVQGDQAARLDVESEDPQVAEAQRRVRAINDIEQRYATILEFLPCRGGVRKNGNSPRGCNQIADALRPNDRVDIFARIKAPDAGDQVRWRWIQREADGTVREIARSKKAFSVMGANYRISPYLGKAPQAAATTEIHLYNGNGDLIYRHPIAVM